MSSIDAEITRFLLETLKEAVTDYRRLKDGAKHEFQGLNNELLLLDAFLMDTAKMSRDLYFFREKERQIRELVYDVDDIIQTCLTKKAAAKTKLVRRIKDKISTRMEKEVKSIRVNRVKPILDEINTKYGQYGNPRRDEGSSSSLVERFPEIMDKLSTPVKVVDFEDEDTIKGYLNETKEELDVIVITGMPGIGKTTFARKIFEHEHIVRDFPERSWNPISERLNFMDVLLNILKNFRHKVTLSSPSEEDLIETVSACLRNKKFLLVMDDVWTAEDWDRIKRILPMGNGEGKVLVTTREEGAVIVPRRAHQLQALNANESLKLLKMKVFDNPEKCPQDFEGIGQQIVEKCNRVPLVILLIGGILKEIFAFTRATPAVIDEWNRVLENMDEKLKEDKGKLISNALELSYKRLARDQRLCFLYMGLFPENHEIPASTLIKLWIAEGFIQRKDGQSIEDTAKQILNSLINMNLLMAAKKNLDQVKKCRVHDMIRAFCITKAAEQNFFRVIESSNTGVFELPVSEVEKFRRLSLHSNPPHSNPPHSHPSVSFSENLNGPGVRSFLCFFKEASQLDTAHVSIIPDAFNLLRILNCKSIKFGEFPKVKKLILLKHISLWIDNLNVLPKEISTLLNLQTLIVHTESHSITVEANIWKMIQLRRLETKAAISLDGKNRKGKARVNVNLQTVSKLSPKSCNAVLSTRAPNLRILGIRGKLANLFDTFSLEEFSQLEKLKLVNDLVNETAASSKPNRGPMLTLSNNPLSLTRQNRFPPKLQRLSLSETHLKWADHMQILAGITTLEVLKLKDDAFTGKSWQVGGVVFQKLQFLLIENSDLEDWDVSETAFPNLRWLVIKSCKQLKAIPERLASLNHLEKLEIERVKKSVAESATTIESIKKLDEENQTSILGVPFKLTIGPGCNLL